MRKRLVSQCLAACGLWLGLPTGLALAVGLSSRQAHSLLIVPIAAGVGVAGAISHVVVLVACAHVRLSRWRQALCVSAGVTGLVLAVGLWLSPNHRPHFASLAELLFSGVVLIAGPSLLFALAITWAIQRQGLGRDLPEDQARASYQPPP